MLGYLSPISHWQQWIAAGMPALDGSVPFNKHTDYNRCRIDSPNGPLTLTIPIKKITGERDPLKSPLKGDLREGLKAKGEGCTIGDVMLSEHGDWRHKHWHALASTYFNSPYFEYYQDDFRPIYFGHQERLIDFNDQLNRLIVELLNIESLKNSGFKFQDSGFKFKVPSYYQVFAHKHGFIADLSIIDLLFNMGPEAILTLCKWEKKEANFGK